MKMNFIDMAKTEYPDAFASMIGYSEAELEKIEALYSVKIQGELRAFLLRAGRYSGGLFSDNPLIIYREKWSVATHLSFKFNLRRDIQDLKIYNEYLNKPFVFAWENESIFYFLQTGKLDDPDQVYVYDENTETVRSAGMTFNEYLLNLLNNTPVGSAECHGELINF